MSDAPRPKRILVVDDEEDVHVLVCRILADSGYAVSSAWDGAQAIESIRESPPDLVVLDLMMPGVDGWAVLEQLRGAPKPPPVVVLTGRGDYGTFTRGVREGVAGYVFKPFRFHELVATCQRVLLMEGSGLKGPADDRRAAPRRSLTVEVKVLSRDRSPIALGELVNLSTTGAQVDLGVPLEPGAHVRVALHIPSGAPLSIEGEVQWRELAHDSFAHGLAFVHLTPEAERHLRELLTPQRLVNSRVHGRSAGSSSR